MVCLYGELHAYQVVSLVPACIHNCQHFLVCRVIILLCRTKLPGVESNWMKLTINLLVENSANSKARSVCMKLKGGVGILRVD